MTGEKKKERKVVATGSGWLTLGGSSLFFEKGKRYCFDDGGIGFICEVKRLDPIGLVVETERFGEKLLGWGWVAKRSAFMVSIDAPLGMANTRKYERTAS